MRTSTSLLVFTALAACLLIGCSGKSGETSTTTTASMSSEKISGSITSDGSSTVYPIVERLAELFRESQSGVNITVGESGTGGGFKKFVNGEIEIANASRPIEDDEIAALRAKGRDFIEIPIAFDGLTVVTNAQNDFCTSLTTAELKKVWSEGSKVMKWSDIRPEFPAEKISLFGAGTDSGTFDYFTKAINGVEKSSRSDYQQSEDDNVLVTGVAGDKYALGYFGYAYYEQNKDQLKAVAIDAGKGPIAPSFETIADQTYQPLSRPLLLYVESGAAKKPEIKAFIKYVLTEGYKQIKDVGYIPFADEDYALILKRVESGKTGSVFKGAEVGLKLADILSRQTE